MVGYLSAACSTAASLEAQLAEAMHNLSCTQQELSKALSEYVSMCCAVCDLHSKQHPKIVCTSMHQLSLLL